MKTKILQILSLPIFLLVVPLSAGGSGVILRAPSGRVPDWYIVQFEDFAVPRIANRAVAEQLAQVHGARLHTVWQHALNGFGAKMSEQAAQALARDPRVRLVAEDTRFWVTADQINPPSWGLDRIDEFYLPMDGKYTYLWTGSNSLVYVLDTGVNHTFAGNIIGNLNFHRVCTGDPPMCTVDPNDYADCYGHGTQVASIVGGTYFGVAKGVALYNVRVLGCTDFDSSVLDVISGINFVIGDWSSHQTPTQPPQTRKPIINMSLIVASYEPLDLAVRDALYAGISVVVSAGNFGATPGMDPLACAYSPARLGHPNVVPNNPEGYSTITVAASSATDQRWTGSNYGGCVDIFAPGLGLTAAHPFTAGATTGFGGTSGAAPHVAGAVAIHYERVPGTNQHAVQQWILDNASDAMTGNLGGGTPDRLLYTFIKRQRLVQ